MKNKRNNIKDTVKNLLMVMMVLTIIALVKVVVLQEAEIVGLHQVINEKENKLVANNISINNALNKIKELRNVIEAQYDIAENLNASIVELKEDNTSLAQDYDEIKAEYDILKEREELYDKYSYAITYNGERTDITYDHIKTLEELCDERGLSPHLILSVGMLESKMNSDCKNSQSTARGAFQFLKGTGRFVYEDYLGYGKGSYDHSMAHDMDIAIQLAVGYFDYLQETRGGSGYAMIQGYSGSSDCGWYIDILNTHLSKVGLNFYDIT